MTEKRFTYLDASRNKYVGSFFCNGIPLTKQEVVDLLNEMSTENRQLKKQMQRLYNYFADWFDGRVPPSDFSEMWDFVKEDEKWD